MSPFRRKNKAILERIEGLHGRKSYEERKAAKLGFVSLYEYFEDKITKEAKALEAEQALRSNSSKLTKKKVLAKKQANSCSCC